MSKQDSTRHFRIRDAADKKKYDVIVPGTPYVHDATTKQSRYEKNLAKIS